jgi:hypothetical protein
MLKASHTIDRYFLEMRNKCLSLAADLDRIARADGGAPLLTSDPRMQKLHKALAVLTGPEAGKAERVQLIFSDLSPGPNAPAK